MSSQQNEALFLSNIMYSKFLSLRRNDKYDSFLNLLQNISDFLAKNKRKYIEESDLVHFRTFLKDEADKFKPIVIGEFDESKLSFDHDSFHSIAKILISFQIHILKETREMESFDFKSILKDLSKNRLKWGEQKNENFVIMILLSVLEVNLYIHLEKDKKLPKEDYLINNAYEYLNIYYDNENHTFNHENIDIMNNEKNKFNYRFKDQKNDNALKSNKIEYPKNQSPNANLTNFYDSNEDSKIGKIPEFKQSSKTSMEEKVKNAKDVCVSGKPFNSKGEELNQVDFQKAIEKDREKKEEKQEENKEEISEKQKKQKNQHYKHEKNRYAECKICGKENDYNYIFQCEKDDQKIENIVCKFCFPFLLKIELLLGESQNILNYAMKDGIDCFFYYDCQSSDRIQINEGEVLSKNELQEIFDYHKLLIEKSKKKWPNDSTNCEKCYDNHPLKVCKKLRADYQQKMNLRACLGCYRPNRKDSTTNFETCWNCNRYYCSTCFQLKDSIEYHPDESMHNAMCKYSNERFYGEKKSGKCTVCGEKGSKCQKPLSDEEFLK